MLFDLCPSTDHVKKPGLNRRLIGPTRHQCFALSSSILLFASLSVLAAPPNVLVLHSYHPGLSWTDTLNDGIIRTFQDEMPEALLWVEYLDTRRNTDATYLPLQAALLRHKLSGNAFNLIIATDNDALDFILRYRDCAEIGRASCRERV